MGLTIQELEEKLKAFDYQYQNSDFHPSWVAGWREEKKIASMIQQLYDKQPKKVKELIMNYEPEYGTQFSMYLP